MVRVLEVSSDAFGSSSVLNKVQVRPVISDNIANTMSSKVSADVSPPAALKDGGVGVAEPGVLLVRRVPREQLRALSVLGAERDLSREAYVRELLAWHTGAGA